MELGLAEMTCWLVHTSYSLPEWQAVKLTFFAPWDNSIVGTFFSISFTKQNCITHKRDTVDGFFLWGWGVGEGRVPIFCTQGAEGVLHVMVSLFLQSYKFEQSCYEMVERQSAC